MGNYVERTWDSIEVGESASFTKTVTETDLVMMAGISGDFNPMHVDEDYASKTQFGGRIAHGVLSCTFISAVLGTKLPGPGCIYGGQEVSFRAPICIGDTVSAVATVEEKFTKKDGKLKFLKIKTEVIIDKAVRIPDNTGKVATTGYATILMLK
ncbi:MAG: MaoC family dehydratase [Candidatus Helarchaeota archaeon]